MTTLASRRLKSGPLAVGALTGILFAAWAAVAVAVWLDELATVPHAGKLRLLVLYGVPLGLAAAALTQRGRLGHAFWLWSGAVWTLAGAMWAAPYVARQPLVVMALPALLASALAARRWPAAFLIAAFALTGTYGSVTAFTPVPPGQLVDVLLAGLWIGTLGALWLRRRDHATILSPGVIVAVLYLVITVGAIAVAPSLDLGLRAFRASSWYMLAFLIVAYGGWPRPTLDRLARAIVIVGVVCGAYATFRWAVGAAPQEKALVDPELLKYNQVANEDKVQGALTSGHELGFWMAIVLPFYVALAVSWRGVWQLLAALAVPLCAVGLLGSGQRTGILGIAAGISVVIVLTQVARGFRGPRLGTALAAMALIGVGAVVAFETVVGDNPEKVQRYKNILDPKHDYPFQQRVFKWQNAFASVEDHPFGRGLGTGGSNAHLQRFPGPASDEVDNSYVKIAYEQGVMVMVLFIVGLLLLLATLVRRAIWTRSSQKAAIAIAASGTLASFMACLVGGLYVNRLAALGAWMIVGLGLAQFARVEPEGDAAPEAA